MSVTVKTADLIQEIDEIELPACGRWPIAAGQPLACVRPRARRSTRLITGGGGLEVADGRLAVTLDLDVRRAGTPSFRLGYRGHLVEADRYGYWRFEGVATGDGGPMPQFCLAVTYLGVYAHGAVPVALLRVRGGSRRPRPGLDIRAELNAHRVVSSPGGFALLTERARSEAMH